MTAVPALDQHQENRAEQLRQLRRQMADVSGRLGAGPRGHNAAGGLLPASETLLAIPETLAASLRAADLDATTLGEVAAVLDAADSMVAASGRARGGLSDRHQAMEDAVNGTPHAAKTSFYRHGGTPWGRAR